MKKFYVYMLLAALCACGGSDNEVAIPTNLVIGIKATDFGNNGNASDIKVIFSVSDITKTTEFRVVLVKTAEEANLTVQEATSLSQDSYFSIESVRRENEFTLDAGMKDVDGNDIQNDVDYTVKVLLVNGNALSIADLKATITLADAHILQGKYIGLWNDNIYTNFGISADLTYQDNVLSGPFYYTGNFTACCGGPDDGKITVRIEDNIITSFVYDQVLITFMNGCNGLYTGTGRVRNTIELDINFEGNDCEGPHTGGRITMTKI